MDDVLDTELAELLRHPGVWQPETPVPPPAVRPPARMLELASLAERLAAEDRNAAALLDSLENKPATWWRTGVMKSAAGRTVGTVRQLLGRMRGEVHKSPARALELTSLAIEIANDISVIDYPS